MTRKKDIPTKQQMACLARELATARKVRENDSRLINELRAAKFKLEAQQVRVHMMIEEFDRRASMTNELRKVARPDSHDEMEAGSSALTWQRSANLLRKAYNG